MARADGGKRPHTCGSRSFGRGLVDHRLAGVEFDCLCVTNLPAEETTGQPRKSCRSSKLRILDQLAPEGVLIVNADDPASLELAMNTAVRC